MSIFPVSLGKIIVVGIFHFVLFSSCFAADQPVQKSFFVMDGSCCGGEDVDPHAIHGIETKNGAFILSGKMIDSSGMEDGFIVKIPSSLPDKKIFLHEEEEYNVEWAVKIGTVNNRDGINSASSLGDWVFAGGFLQNKRGIIDSYLVKLNEISGDIIWAISYPSRNENRESAIETLVRSSDNGIIIGGVRNSQKGTLEGFKSYGNPLTGNAYIMYFSKHQINSKIAPRKPTWEIDIKGAVSIKHLAVLPNGGGYILAAHSDGEPFHAKVLKISTEGKVQWELEVPIHGELTALVATENGHFLSGHKTDQFNGIDASISKISLSGEFVWNKTYGNPTGGDTIFSKLDGGDPNLIYDECWSITQFKIGLVLACGTGIEHCEGLSTGLRSVCENDPRTTWRSYLIHVDFSGNLIWQRASSFMFDGDEDDIPSTSSEWVFLTASGGLASVVDLSFGIGLEVLK